MNWQSFIKIQHDAHNKMQMIRRDFQQFHKFLKSSHLIIARGSNQYEFKINLDIIDMTKRIELIMDSLIKEDLVDSISVLKGAESLKSKIRYNTKNNINKKSNKEINESIDSITSSLSAISVTDLEIENDFDIFIAFPSVYLEVITAVKTHPLVNRDKTCLCRSCVRSFLY